MDNILLKLILIFVITDDIYYEKNNNYDYSKNISDVGRQTIRYLLLLHIII